MSRHQFGGDGWTEPKLAVFREYAKLYTTALRGQFARVMYIDAFAGTGSRVGPGSSAEDVGRARVLPGSARLALECVPGFNELIFIDRKRTHVAALEHLKSEYPEKAKEISVFHADANKKLQEVCSHTEWGWKRRALAFLDPYGMQVDWRTLETIARTQAIDMWLLFPSGIGVNRLLVRDGKIPVHWEQTLDRLFGGTQWRDAFYVPNPQGDFFDDETRIKDAKVDTIEREYMDRLRTIFPRIHNRTLRLRNKTNSVMYSLIFCCSNPSPAASSLALRLADAAMKKWHG